MAVLAAGMLGILTACSSASGVSNEAILQQTSALTDEEQDTTAADVQGSVAESAAETVSQEVPEEETQETTEEGEPGSGEDPTEEISVLSEPRLPAGHRIIYSDGEIYGWTRYEYDELGRRDMLIFITPKGDEYWSPVYYDGNSHVIPETVGDWSTLNEDGLYLEVGTEDNRGRRTPLAEYTYDDKGNLTDYWYMFVSGKYQRHVVYQYDSRDRLVREEMYNARSGKLLSYIEYIYDGQGYLIRMNEVEEGRVADTIQYTIYQYDENGRLSRAEKIWGGAVHDYVEYTYNEAGELIREYHYLEDPMMGGPYTVEYLFEAIDDSAG